LPREEGPVTAIGPSALPRVIHISPVFLTGRRSGVMMSACRHHRSQTSRSSSRG
jgi:hypothetical protein